MCLGLVLFLSGCSKQVVLEPVALKPVPSSMLRAQPAPKCGDQVGDDATVHVGEILASRECYRGAEEISRRRLGALQRAVRSREQAAKKLVGS